MKKLILVAVFAAFACLMSSPVPFNQVSAQNNGASHVRWDIISVNFATTPITISAGGVAFASADPDHKIELTGSGTFVAPASGGTSSGVTGGGTWKTFGPPGGTVLTGEGTYEVKKLASWQFALFQTPGAFFDDIDAQTEAADGNAILLIEYSDGSQGILGIGCDGSLIGPAKCQWRMSTRTARYSTLLNDHARFGSIGYSSLPRRGPEGVPFHSPGSW